MLGHISLNYTYDGISKWLEIFKSLNARTPYYLKACFDRINKEKINRSTHYTSYYCYVVCWYSLFMPLLKSFKIF